MAHETSWPIDFGFLTAFSFLSGFLVLIPLIWHIQAWNIGCILFIFWAALLNLGHGINQVIWRDSAKNFAPVFCDIWVRLEYAGKIGICAACLVIARRISKIATSNSVATTIRDKRNVILVDLAIGLSFPLAQIVIFWFIQGHRFDIYEGWGCMAAIPNTYIVTILYTAWPIPIGLTSACYCFITVRAMLKRRKQMVELLGSDNSSLSLGRYHRLMAMALVEVCTTVPVGLFDTISTYTSTTLYPYKGLADLHLGFERVRQFPAGIWLNDGSTYFSSNFDHWLLVATSLVFFSFFGLGEEAIKHYRFAYTSIAKRVGLSTGSLESTGRFGSSKISSSFGKVTIPTFIQRNQSKRDSLSSFNSDRLSTAISIGDFPPDEEKAPYSPSSSSGSSSCLPTPADEKSHEENLKEKSNEIAPWESIQLPSLPIDAEHGIERPTPDVPSPIRNSLDMV
ncbi:pheromone A receptor-domain-containing protein [Abortiporus biennis]|nr:pheromone A receptor-domain-containing protein [Abortiporus biennis]